MSQSFGGESHFCTPFFKVWDSQCRNILPHDKNVPAVQNPKPIICVDPYSNEDARTYNKSCNFYGPVEIFVENLHV